MRTVNMVSKCSLVLRECCQAHRLCGHVENAGSMTDEQWQIKRFLELLKDAPKGEVKYLDKPDALVCGNGKVVGIEHTRLIRPSEEGSDLRAFEAITDRIVERAQKLAEDRGIKPFHVFVHFDERVRLFKQEIEATAQAIAEIVCRHEPPDESEVTIEAWRYELRGLPFPTSIKHIAVYHRKAWHGPLWQVPRTSALPQLTLEFIQDRVREKEKRLPVYRRRCDEAWLLLVVEGFAPSGTWDLQMIEYDQPILTSFDRLFLYDQFRANPRELRSEAT